MKSNKYRIKQLLPIVALSALLVLPSCNKAQQGQNSSDSLTTDSITENTALAGNLKPDSMGFLSPDWRFFDLKGKVKKVTVKHLECDENGNYLADNNTDVSVCVFTENGMIDLTSQELNLRLNAPKIKRNGDGRIKEMAWYIEEYATDVTEMYTYDERGFRIKTYDNGIESTDTMFYVFDKKGSLTLSRSIGAGEGSVFQSEHEYTILDKDEHDNWTKRIIKSSYLSGPDDGSGKMVDQIDCYELELRTITYF